MNELKNSLLNEAANLTSSLTKDMKSRYSEYLTKHIENVKKAYQWIKENLPGVINKYCKYSEDSPYYGRLDSIIKVHDQSKYLNGCNSVDEYCDLKKEFDPYGFYFYGDKNAAGVKENFDLAWLSHIHQSPHHWQHWILVSDSNGTRCIDIPGVFIIEMICDWWAFSWISGNLNDIFTWYEKNKKGIQVSSNTRKILEDVLDEIKLKIEEQNEKITFKK